MRLEAPVAPATVSNKEGVPPVQRSKEDGQAIVALHAARARALFHSVLLAEERLFVLCRGGVLNGPSVCVLGITLQFSPPIRQQTFSL